MWITQNVHLNKISVRFSIDKRVYLKWFIKIVEKKPEIRYPDSHMKKEFVLFISILLALCSCSRQIIPEKPVTAESAFRLDTLPLSEIDIPIRVNLKPLYQLAEKNVQKLYTSPGYPTEYVTVNCDTKYMYRFKRGPLKLAAEGNAVQFGFTGFYLIAGSQRICAGSGDSRVPLSPWSPPCTCGLNDGDRRVEIGFKTTLGLRSNYTVSSSIATLDPVALDKCSMCIWNQDITQTVLAQIKLQLNDSRNAMQDSLNRLNLRPQFQKLWDRLNDSQSLYGLGYLQINPQRIRLSNFYAHQDTLQLSVGISARPVVTLEKTAGSRTIIPDISDFNRRSGFSIFVDAILNYDSLSNLLTAQVKGRRIELEQMHKFMVIESCSIYGVMGDKLIFKMAFSGSEKGILYLTGKPVLDKESGKLEIHEIEYDLQTKDLLVKTAKWLFSKRILNELRRHSSFDLHAYETPLLARINTALNGEMVKGIMLSGSVESLQAIAIYPTLERLVVRCSAKGSLSMLVNSLNF